MVGGQPPLIFVTYPLLEVTSDLLPNIILSREVDDEELGANDLG
jgi:hypothetical protein